MQASLLDLRTGAVLRPACGTTKENGHRNGARFRTTLATQPGLEPGTCGLTERAILKFMICKLKILRIFQLEVTTNCSYRTYAEPPWSRLRPPFKILNQVNDLTLIFTEPEPVKN
jgi:hypothetical protein